MKAIEKAGYKPGEDVMLALDPASTEFFKKGKYELDGEGKSLDAGGMVDYYADARRQATRSSRSRTAWPRTTWQRLEGDHRQARQEDPARRRRSLRHQPEAAGSRASRTASPTPILVKVNQIGTLTETMEAVSMARNARYGAVMSHRSGETEDSTIADLAVATNCGQIKTGSLSRSDRLAKYNQLLRIEEQLGTQARYAGRSILKASS